MVKMYTRRDMTDRWVYPSMDKAMKAVGLEEVKTYTICFQNTAAYNMANGTIMELCLAVEQRQVA